MEEKYPYENVITENVSFQHLDPSLHCHDEVESTMEEAWNLFHASQKDSKLGQVVVADHQTSGRGRHGREWFSPAGSGIWVSILLKAKLPAQQLYPHLTVIGALAVVETVESNTDTQPRIRWPNDVVYEQDDDSTAVKKFSGVLVETKQIGDRRRPRAVVGCGINVNIPQDEFPEDLRDEATSIQAKTESTWDRNLLLRGYLTAFDQKLDELYRHNHEVIDNEWSTYSAVINQRVQVRSEERLMKGTVEDVSLENGLTLRMDEGGYRIFEPSHVDELRIISMEPAAEQT